MDYIKLFDSIHPGFFRREDIRNKEEDEEYAELVMDLHELPGEMKPVSCPEGITFGEYRGDPETVRKAVRKVLPDWVPYYKEGARVFCALDGEKIASFCMLEDMGTHDGIRVGGPGCVGTVPEYRKKGIGLEMVRLATEIFREEGYDLSWIHYTGVAHWYSKLGYRPVLRWNRSGFLPEA